MFNQIETKGGSVILDYLNNYLLVRRKDTKETLAFIGERHRSSKLTPELLSLTWQDLWTILALPHDLRIKVPPYPKSQNNVSGLKSENLFAIYLPPELAKVSDLSIYPRLFPALENSLDKFTSDTENIYQPNGSQIEGWMTIEGVNSPAFLGTTTEELANEIDSQDRLPATLNAFLVGSFGLQILEGHNLSNYPNISGHKLYTYRLPGTLFNGKAVTVEIRSPGYLTVQSGIKPDDKMGFVGGLSVGFTPSNK